MDIVDQILGSQLSKQARTNPSGIFEAVPANAAGVIRTGVAIPTSIKPPPSVDPLDTVSNNPSQPTYLDYLKTSKKV